MTKTLKKKTTATFEIRFDSRGIDPENIPPRILYDALAAIQDLASGRDPFEIQHVPVEKIIGLVDVRRGSAIYGCVSRDPKEAMKNLLRVGALLTASFAKGNDGSDELVAMLRPIEVLSGIAKSVGCRIEVSLGGRKSPLFSVAENDYEQLSKNLFMTGETTVIGMVERVGGATEMRCLLRVPGRRRLLYCSLRDRELARRIGQHLYERIVAQGTATWLHQSWRIVKFKINDFAQPSLRNPAKAINDLRQAGFDAWDQITDPEEYLRECHS